MRPQATAYTRCEGGRWDIWGTHQQSGAVHAIRFSDDSVWDTFNGWRPDTLPAEDLFDEARQGYMVWDEMNQCTQTLFGKPAAIDLLIRLLEKSGTLPPGTRSIPSPTTPPSSESASPPDASSFSQQVATSLEALLPLMKPSDSLSWSLTMASGQSNYIFEGSLHMAVMGFSPEPASVLGHRVRSGA